MTVCMWGRQRALQVLLLLAVVSGCGPRPEGSGLERVRRSGVLRWGVDVQGGEPYAAEDPERPGQLRGFEVELAAALGRELGVRAEPVQNDGSSLVPALERGGAFDVALNGLEVTPARAGRVLLSQPYFLFRLRLMARAGDGSVSGLESLRGRRVGRVFQQWHLFEHRTALGNVVEGLVYVRGMKPREARAWARELLAQVGMTHREEAYPEELSGGEQQRVALARALALQPEVLLLDEPTSALDPERVGEVKELLRRLSGGGLALVVVTHEMGFVRGLASRVLVLHGGQVVEQGTPAEVLERPRHERTRAFLGLGRGQRRGKSRRVTEVGHVDFTEAA